MGVVSWNGRGMEGHRESGFCAFGHWRRQGCCWAVHRAHMM